ncbi:hypothetical protein BDP27DRAFT_1344248 [Rhodocollybia butyracea]|uniref:DUF6534 domain-containing protein n=1 Tax=Rhodocollybia butyracea TaxID=206335 RepID=A0A9P5P9X1_9AGAR|nr:hypothetical protein BDP27DRAFT_1344248 [Rhodocollybia butyracea]
MASSSLAPTWGIWLISAFLMSILYGAGLLQVFLYFKWYPNDWTGIKLSVVAITILESLEISIFYYGTYLHLIGGLEDPTSLLSVFWPDSIHLLFMYLSSVTAQLYFTYCIFKFTALTVSSKTARLGVPFMILLLILLELGAGIAQVIETLSFSSFVQLSSVKTRTSLQSATAVAVDVLITLSLVIILRKNKGQIDQTNSMISILIIYAINRGILTAACALSNLILFLAVPGTFYFFIGLNVSSKRYMNSMLATLNTRSHVRKQSESGSGIIDWGTILSSNQSDTVRLPSIKTVIAPNHFNPDINIHVEAQTSYEMDNLASKNSLSTGQSPRISPHKGSCLA